ncbi:MAG: hypothetical protein JSV94_05335 [Methanobacteriota archaeon]|nr:MAG: hypothetical protein JSV94_05335 [Euryarchaeota archaeon]
MKILLLFGILLVTFGAQMTFAGLRVYSAVEHDNEAVRDSFEEAGLETDSELLQPTSMPLIISIVGAVVLTIGMGLIIPSILWKRRFGDSSERFRSRARKEPQTMRNERRFCRNCGNLDLRDAEFCPQCGEAFGKTIVE